MTVNGLVDLDIDSLKCSPSSVLKELGVLDAKLGADLAAQVIMDESKTSEINEDRVEHSK